MVIVKVLTTKEGLLCNCLGNEERLVNFFSLCWFQVRGCLLAALRPHQPSHNSSSNLRLPHLQARLRWLLHQELPNSTPLSNINLCLPPDTCPISTEGTPDMHLRYHLVTTTTGVMECRRDTPLRDNNLPREVTRGNRSCELYYFLRFKLIVD